MSAPLSNQRNNAEKHLIMTLTSQQFRRRQVFHSHLYSFHTEKTRVMRQNRQKWIRFRISEATVGLE